MEEFMKLPLWVRYTVTFVYGILIGGIVAYHVLLWTGQLGK